MIWEPNEYGNFKMYFAMADIHVTVGADSVTKKRMSSGMFTQELLKRPYFDLWMEVDGDITIDLGRCRPDIGVDDLYWTVIRKARKWLSRRLSALPLAVGR